MLNKPGETMQLRFKELAAFLGISLFTAAFAASVLAQASFHTMKDPEGFSKRLSEVTQNTNSIESRFIQEKHMEAISEIVISKGIFFFKKENKLRWEYTYPFNYLIIMDGEKILVRDETRESRFDASSNKLFTEINSIMLGAIRGTILKDERSFKAEYMENNEFYLVRMAPLSQQMKSYLSGIRIFFSKASYAVAKLEMEESSGDYTKIEFAGMKVNTPIPDEKFSVR